MENRTLNTKNLRLARVKYYDVAHNGAELSEMEAYAFLQKVGDQYKNVFDEAEDLPVLDRSIYPNVMRSGEEYGNRLIHVCGELTDGACYVIEPVDLHKLFGVDIIGTNDLKDYMFHSEKFFVDRAHLIQGEKASHRLRMFSLLRADLIKLDAFKQYIASHEKAKQYVK